jgi:hypothetical protein
MSGLRAGDESMHYQDGSHRWISPNGTKDQRSWEDGIREHQRRHREALGDSRTGVVGQRKPAAGPIPARRR